MHFVMLASLLAQAPPTIPVLGVGKVAFDVNASLTDAQAQMYRAYLDGGPAIMLTVMCAGTAAPVTCEFPLSQLNLTGTHTLALTSVVVAADGEQESGPVPAPFVLRKVGPPAAPISSTFQIQP